MFVVSPHGNVKITTHAFTTIKSLSSIYNYSLYSKIAKECLLDNIGKNLFLLIVLKK
jgi:hypothetical protein